MGDLTDVADDLVERERAAAIERHRARPRAAGPAFTRCVVCDDDIPPGRQAAVPGTRLCVGCRGELEGVRR